MFSVKLNSFALVLAFATSIFAYEGPVHDLILERVFFGSKNANLNFEERKQLENINKASYLYIDYFKGKGSKASRYLKDLGMTIDTSSIETPTNNHQVYTHLGWDEERYVGQKENYKKIRETRKNILLTTIRRIFPGAIPKEQECLAKLVYYIHIIGDHEGDKPESSFGRIPLVPWEDAPHESYTIYTELIKIIKRLPQNEHSFELIGFLESNKNKTLCRKKCSSASATNFCDVSGESWKDDKVRVNIYCFAAKTTDMLQKHLPKILADIEYFSEAFPEFYKQAENTP